MEARDRAPQSGIPDYALRAPSGLRVIVLRKTRRIAFPKCSILLRLCPDRHLLCARHQTQSARTAPVGYADVARSVSHGCGETKGRSRSVRARGCVALRPRSEFF